MTKLFIVRHAETEWNRNGRLQGWKNAPLTDKGKKQAKMLKDRLNNEPIDIAYSSPLGRTCDTADILLDGRDVPLIKDDRLKEINMGRWEGVKSEEVKEKNPDLYNTFWSRPDKYEPITGESYHELQERVLSGLNEIIKKHPGENILLISHGCATKIIMAYFESKPLKELWNPPKIKEASLSIVDVKDGKPNILLYGDTSHYKE